MLAAACLGGRLGIAWDRPFAERNGAIALPNVNEVANLAMIAPKSGVIIPFAITPLSVLTEGSPRDHRKKVSPADFRLTAFRALCDGAPDAVPGNIRRPRTSNAIRPNGLRRVSHAAACSATIFFQTPGALFPCLRTNFPITVCC